MSPLLHQLDAVADGLTIIGATTAWATSGVQSARGTLVTVDPTDVMLDRLINIGMERFISSKRNEMPELVAVPRKFYFRWLQRFMSGRMAFQVFGCMCPGLNPLFWILNRRPNPREEMRWMEENGNPPTVAP